MAFMVLQICYAHLEAKKRQDLGMVLPFLLHGGMIIEPRPYP